MDVFFKDAGFFFLFSLILCICMCVCVCVICREPAWRLLPTSRGKLACFLQPSTWERAAGKCEQYACKPDELLAHPTCFFFGRPRAASVCAPQIRARRYCRMKALFGSIPVGKVDTVRKGRRGTLTRRPRRRTNTTWRYMKGGHRNNISCAAFIIPPTPLLSRLFFLHVLPHTDDLGF